MDDTSGAYYISCMHALVGHVPCNLETSRSLQTARPPFQWRVLHCTCLLVLLEYHTDLPALLELHARVCFGEITSKKTERIVMIFIVLYCVRNWEGISVVENLVRHNNRSFRANKLVIVSPKYK